MGEGKGEGEENKKKKKMHIGGGYNEHARTTVFKGKKACVCECV